MSGTLITAESVASRMAAVIERMRELREEQAPTRVTSFGVLEPKTIPDYPLILVDHDGDIIGDWYASESPGGVDGWTQRFERAPLKSTLNERLAVAVGGDE